MGVGCGFVPGITSNITAYYMENMLTEIATQRKLLLQDHLFFQMELEGIIRELLDLKSVLFRYLY